MVSLSKWFVGSSNINNSHGVISADAKETLFFVHQKVLLLLVKVSYTKFS